MSEVLDGEKASSEREERLKASLAVIGRYSSRHVKIDVGIGVAGILPGMGKVALIGAIALQAPVIYQPMVREIGAWQRRDYFDPSGGIKMTRRCLRRFSRLPCDLPRLEAVAFSSELKDNGMMDEAIDDHASRHGVRKYLRPVLECKVGSESDTRAFVSLCDYLEHEIGRFTLERNISEFVDQ